jgi:hypothetical protein
LLARASSAPARIHHPARVGASRGRLVAQCLTEGLVLSSIGGVCGSPPLTAQFSAVVALDRLTFHA